MNQQNRVSEETGNFTPLEHLLCSGGLHCRLGGLGEGCQHGWKGWESTAGLAGAGVLWTWAVIVFFTPPKDPAKPPPLPCAQYLKSC